MGVCPHTPQPSATSLKKLPTATMSFHQTKVLHQNTFRFWCLNKPSSRSFFGDPLKVQLPYKQVTSQTNCLRLRFYLPCPLWSSYIACRARRALELVHQECPSGRLTHLTQIDAHWGGSVCLEYRVRWNSEKRSMKTYENQWNFHKQQIVKSK